MRIYVCGTRGSTPAPGPEFCRYGGHTASIAIGETGGLPRLIIDAGTGIRLVSQMFDGRPFRGSVLLSHLHWDHLQGLPFFSSGDRPDSRVDVYLPEQEGEATTNLANVMAPPHFPITPSELRGHWTFAHLPAGTRQIEGYGVTGREIPHKGGTTFGYRVEDEAAVVAYLSDHSPFVLGPGPEGFGPYHEAALDLSTGADLLIHDAQYLDPEWPSYSHFGHSTASYALGLAREAGVKRLLMFHHDPTRTDAALDLLSAEWANESDIDVMAARQGDVIDLP